jgi:hypothetical protein
MKTIIERVIKQTSVKAPAWVDGSIRIVYIQDNHLNGSKAKLFSRYDKNKKIDVIRGRTYLNEQNILYFVPD